eukprot:scaffold4416_cov228-Prasinococcus_capsulatus_cf.AAC.4
MLWCGWMRTAARRGRVPPARVTRAMAGWRAGALFGRSVGRLVWWGSLRWMRARGRPSGLRWRGAARIPPAWSRGWRCCGSEWVTRRRPRPRHARGRECWRSYLVGVVVAARGPQRFRVVVVGGGRGTAWRCALPAALAPRAASARAAPPPERSPPVSDALQ